MNLGIALTGIFRSVLLLLSPWHFAANWKNILLWMGSLGKPDVIETWAESFDPAYYLRTYPDVATSRVDPFLHFLICGNRERRNPSARFDSAEYLDFYPEVARAGLNPLLHYAVFGKKEGRIAGRRTSHAAGTVDPVRLTNEVTVIQEVKVVNNAWRRDLPLISVVIPCFNYGHYLADAIQSIHHQTFQNVEIIVVEGGSTDAASIAAARRLQASGLSNTTFYFREGRHLAGDNRNFGIGLARGRYVCCLDADDMLRPVYLEVAVFLAEAFGFDLVYPCYQAFGGSTFRWMVGDASFPSILDYNQVTTVALFRRAAWAHVGGYRDWGLGEQYVWEDWEFWARLLGHGSRARAIREPLMLYRAHDAGLTATSTSATLDRQKEQLLEANDSLLASFEQSQAALRILQPFVNLDAADDDPRPGFIVALPFIAIGGAEKLFGEIIEYLAARNERLIIVTTLILSPAIPDDRNRFDPITRHIYHLGHLFSDEHHAQEFLKYLIRRYRVNLLMLAGCDLIYRMLPELRTEYPALAVVDQLFNDTVHLQSNRRESGYIDATVVPSTALSAKLQGGNGKQPHPVHVIPHGVAIAPAHNIEHKPNDDSVTVAFFGRLSPEKGPDLFVEIVRRLSQHKDLRFVMTGDGPESANVKALIAKYRLQERIHAPGFVDDVTPLMRSADIVVLPSRIDGMPLAVLEAQAMGKPVVASEVGSLPQMIAHGESGYLCESGDLQAFCRRILELANDAPLRTRMGQAGQRLMAQNHNGAKMLEQYQRVFDEARSAALSRTQHDSGREVAVDINNQVRGVAR